MAITALVVKPDETDTVFTNTCSLPRQVKGPKHVICITVNQMEIRQHVSPAFRGRQLSLCSFNVAQDTLLKQCGPYVTQATSECDLSDWISSYHHCVLGAFTSVLRACDQITQEGL